MTHIKRWFWCQNKECERGYGSTKEYTMNKDDPPPRCLICGTPQEETSKEVK